MVKIEILLFATLRDKYGVRKIEIECDGTIRNLIENAARRLEESFLASVYDLDRDKVRDDLIFAINGRNIKDLKGEIELRSGDVIAIFPPVAGG
jgi:molybdopterin synthase sulfur carrier subunit